ncbi:T9SS type A sorting domain-containing protein [Tamlana crocina]|uniref:T9SS type A sorting domain-containing protein n=1 Tax=Tamlana crocina TaxID=393006 RepID=A0ABX1D998_9FLAO|nr:T9SS type A sorting domain-containing protein [Tamlana crocina]NJX14577.1 T9SS type A sorting domain-containing protein [Tamlana crocina]
MKRLILILIILVAFTELRAQISAGEYFFDNDPGIGNGIALTLSGNELDVDFNIPTTGLSSGVHNLYVRVLDQSGNWSLYDKNVFYVNPNNENSANIASAEYFFDTDPGVGNGTGLTVSGNVVDQDFSIATTGLSSGVHKLYVRLVNTDGTWSLYDKNVFYVSPDNENSANIASAEYFFDTDPGVGNGTALAVSGNIIDQNLSIPTTGLSNGIHKLYVRMVNTDDTWSLYDKNVFYVDQGHSNTALITAAEYFFDIDPGIGNATAIDLDDEETIDMDMAIDVPTDLPEGDHFLYMRVKNTNGQWSLYALGELQDPLSAVEEERVQFKFYPNPVKDVVHFKLQNQGILDLKVINLKGAVMFENQLENYKIDLSFLSPGVYLFYLKTENVQVSRKFVKH